jgi:hypothetical protein
MTRIEEIIETLVEGDEVTLVLKSGEQVTGLYRGLDNETVILKAKSGNAPDLGWSVDAIEDIVPCDVEPAGDIVKVDFTDVKTGRKVVANIDLTGEQAEVKVEFVPAVHRDEIGWHIHFASKFLSQLTGCEDSDEAEG